MTRNEFISCLYKQKNDANREKEFKLDLFKLGADDHPDSWLHASVMHANQEVVEQLLKEGADVNRIIDGDSVLGCILPMEDVDPFLEVIASHGKPELNTEEQDPAKIWRVVQTLLQHGAKAINNGKKFEDAEIQNYFQYFKYYYSL